MATGRRVPLVAGEPRLIVAEEDQDVGGRPTSDEMAVVVDVVRRQEGGGLRRGQGSIIGELDPGRRVRGLPDDVPAAVGLGPDDRADRDPRPVIVDRAHLALRPVDERQSRSARGSVDREGTAAIAEPPDPAIQVSRSAANAARASAIAGRSGAAPRRTRGPARTAPDRRVGRVEAGFERHDPPPISRLRRSTNAAIASARSASIGGGSNSARSCFQMPFARSVAVFRPSSAHVS